MLIDRQKGLFLSVFVDDIEMGGNVNERSGSRGTNTSVRSGTLVLHAA